MRTEYEKICRICGNYHTELMPIFKNEGLEHGLPQKIRQHFYTVTISESDDLPLQICYQCVSALVSWHDLFELCEEVNKKFICCTSKSKDEWKNSDFTCKKVSSSEAEKQDKEEVSSNVKKETDSNLISDLKEEDSNVMFVSLDNMKVDGEFLFETSTMSEKNDDILKSENHTPNDSMDMEYSEEDRKYDDNSSLDGNPPSIVLDRYGNIIDECDQISPISEKEIKEKSRILLPKKYTTEMIQLALAEIQRTEKPLSMKRAAYKYNIPLSTLNDKFTGKSAPVAMKKGRLTILGHEIEQKLVQWILQCRNEGFPLYRDGLFYSVRKFVSDNPSFNSEDCPFKNGQPTTKWFVGFLRRHPSISSRFFESRKRMRLSTPIIRKWFNHLKRTVGHEIFSEADRIWVIEVKALLVDPMDKKVFTDSVSCFHLMNSQTERETVTVVMATNAAATIGPRMVVYKEGREPCDFESTKHGWILTTSVCGCVGAEALYQYFHSQFLPFLRASKVTFPVVVFLDNKHARISLQLMELCQENSIKLVTFLPDSSLWFHPVNLIPAKMEHQWKKVSKENIPTLLDNVITDEKFCESIKDGFRKCGLYPFDPYKITVNSSNVSEIEKKANRSISMKKKTFSKWLERQLSPELLSTFQRCYQECSSWTGNEIHKTAYELWTRSLENEKFCKNTFIDHPFFTTVKRFKSSRYHTPVPEEKIVTGEYTLRETFTNWLELHLSEDLLKQFKACYEKGDKWNGEEIHKTAYEMWVKNLEYRVAPANLIDDYETDLLNSSRINVNSVSSSEEDEDVDDDKKLSSRSSSKKSFSAWFDQLISSDLLEKFWSCYHTGNSWNGPEIHTTAYEMWVKILESKLNHENSFIESMDQFEVEEKDMCANKPSVGHLSYLHEWLKEQISPDLIDEFQVCYQQEKTWNGEEMHKTAFDMWSALQSKMAVENCSIELDEVWLQPEISLN